jgi:peptidyl-prolyl cis-trans isomerase C
MWVSPSVRTLLMTALVAALACCSRPESEDVLARVGDAKITAPEFNRLLQARQALSPVPVKAEALLNEWVEREVLVQNALQEGLQDDSEVHELIRDVLIAKYRERHLDSKIEQSAVISEEELRQAYEEEKPKLITPERVRLALLHLTVPDGEAEQTQQRMRVALAHVGQSGDLTFGKLAVDFSDDQESRYRGGEIGWVERERFPPRLDPAIIKAGFVLSQPGEVSDVFHVKSGVCAVRLVERETASPITLEKAGPILRQKLALQKQEKIQNEFQAKLREGLRIDINTERLKGLLAATQVEPPPPSIP